MEDEKYNCEIRKFKKIQGSLIALLFIAIVCQACIFFTTISFIIKFRTNKKVFALFMICLNISLIWRLAYISEQIYQNRAHKCESEGECLNAFISYSNIIFLAVAGFLNIYNWLAFTFTLRGFHTQTNKSK